MIDLIIPIQQTAALVLACCLGIGWLMEQAGVDNISDPVGWTFTILLGGSIVVTVVATLVRIWV